MSIHPSISKEAEAYMGTARDLASALLCKPRARQTVHILTKAFGGGLGTRYTVLVVPHGRETGEYYTVNERTLEALKQGASPTYLELEPSEPEDDTPEYHADDCACSAADRAIREAKEAI